MLALLRPNKQESIETSTVRWTDTSWVPRTVRAVIVVVRVWIPDAETIYLSHLHLHNTGRSESALPHSHAYLKRIPRPRS